MSDNDDFIDDDVVERLREKYPDWYDRSWVRTSYKLLHRGINFERASPKRKAQMTKNFHRRLKVYTAIGQSLLSGPKSFTALWKVVGGSRSTVSNCLKGLCEDEIVRRNSLTRDYELLAVGSRNLEEIRTPSTSYCKRKIRNDRTVVTEDCSAVFYPRTGLVRIDESKPNLEAAMAALLNPVYFALRKSGTIKFEIEVNLKARGKIEIAPSQRERDLAEWKEKEARWRNEERYDRQMSWISRKRRVYS